jgi:glycosyltransferase involved in cell wall biosynthesis
MGAPQVSVVVATRDRARRLDALLSSLRSQTLPADDFEVIVVDDGSRDATQEVLARHASAGGLHLSSVRHAESQGAAAARNAGWRRARAPLIAFTDDDCTAAPNWLEAGLRVFAEHPRGVIQGRVEINPDELDRLDPFAHFMVQHGIDAGFPTANIFYPRELVEELDGFDAVTFPTVGGEDTDLAWRAFELGASSVWAPDALVYHGVTRVGAIRRLRVAARWTPTVQVYKRHPEMRRELVHGLFWRENHWHFTRFVVALALPRRLGALRLVLAAPYVSYLVERRTGPLLAPYLIALDAVEVWAIVRGAIRYRTLVI